MNKRKTTIQIAEQLIVNTEKQPEAIHGVHDGYTILQKIINKQSNKETGFSIRETSPQFYLYHWLGLQP